MFWLITITIESEIFDTMEHYNLLSIGKVKCTLVQALRLCTGRTAHSGSRGIALLFYDHGTRRSKGSASRSGSSLPLGKTRYLLYRRLSGPQGWSGQVWKILPPPGFVPWTVEPVASRYTDYPIRTAPSGVSEVSQQCELNTC